MAAGNTHDDSGHGGHGELATTHVTPHEKQRAEAMRDHIAQQMWESYQNLLCQQEEEGREVDTN